MPEKRDYDAVVVGSGPNGLAAAITLQRTGLKVAVFEAKETIGGGTRSSALTLPGFTHDVCSSVHPLFSGSPFFANLPLHEHGLEWLYPPLAAAHPFDDGTAAILEHSLENTIERLGVDGPSYQKLFAPIVKNWHLLANDLLAPLHVPKHPLLMARFGLHALQSAKGLADRFFKEKYAKALMAGVSAHILFPITIPTTASISLVLMTLAHRYGWPIPKGGSQKIADAMASYFKSLGGEIFTNSPIKSYKQLPGSHCVLFDVSPMEMLKIAGEKFSHFYKWQLNNFKYSPGVFKIDWALNEAIPFKAESCKKAGTVHIGGTMEEIIRAEKAAHLGRHSDKPFVLLVQQSIVDETRAPEGKHTGWAYCHVPNGSNVDMTKKIEDQVERFAPGFKDIILAKHTISARAYEDYNANYVGGDINAGAQILLQVFFRPAFRISPYKTSAKGYYICSSSTPPGGGVHGMCGFRAAQRALKDIFGIEVSDGELGR